MEGSHGRPSHIVVIILDRRIIVGRHDRLGVKASYKLIRTKGLLHKQIEAWALSSITSDHDGRRSAMQLALQSARTGAMQLHRS